MAQLAAIAAGGAQAYKGYQIRKQKIAETKAYREAKNRSMAATTREIAEEERDKEFMYSRALAVAAASGGGVGDPGVVKLLADLNAEGEYRVMSKLWSGLNEAQGLIFRAEEAKSEGDAAFTAGIFNAFTAAGTAYAGAGGSFGGGGEPFTPTASAPLGATDAIKFNPDVMYA